MDENLIYFNYNIMVHKIEYCQKVLDEIKLYRKVLGKEQYGKLFSKWSKELNNEIVAIESFKKIMEV